MPSREAPSAFQGSQGKMNTHTALRDRFAAAALPGVFAVAVELPRMKSEDTLADPASIAGRTHPAHPCRHRRATPQAREKSSNAGLRAVQSERNI
jgi:hypothetical protein